MLSSPLNCDLYHLTMAQSLFLDNSYDQVDCFEMFIRQCPFKSAYTICGGISDFLKWVNNWKFDEKEINYLKNIKAKDGSHIFNQNFLEFLKSSKLDLKIDTIKEGEIFFPNEPIIRVIGKSWLCNMVEGAMLNIINSQSLIATKASRVCYASSIDGVKRNVLEFGLRRSQEAGSLHLTKAAFIGGCFATSNVLAGMEYDIPVIGTHAHSYVMHYPDEVTAFEKYLTFMPSNSTLLIDTYDTINGAKNAIKAYKKTGVKPVAVRLDSGDFAFLSLKVRQILDEAGLNDTKIVVSNDLDEYTIQSLIIEQKSAIDIFAVGTKLITAYDQPALGGVFKLKVADGIDKIKVSNQAIKTTIPGATNTLRTYKDGMMSGDIIIPKNKENIIKDGILSEDITSINPENQRPKLFKKGTCAKLLMKSSDNFNHDVNFAKNYAKENLEKLDKSHQRLFNPHLYICGIEESLFNKRNQMIKENM